jgi:hypothetical protein
MPFIVIHIPYFILCIVPLGRQNQNLSVKCVCRVIYDFLKAIVRHNYFEDRTDLQPSLVTSNIMLDIVPKTVIIIIIIIICFIATSYFQGCGCEPQGSTFFITLMKAVSILESCAKIVSLL